MAKDTNTSAAASVQTKIDFPTTQRAYTLRLRGADPSDQSWRDALWATHEAINNGAKAFGDWLLTLRGGLCHTLANEPPVDEPRLKAARKALSAEFKGKKDESGKVLKPTDQQVRERAEADRHARIRNRRILLALSWLSVEDEDGAPKGDVRVASGRDSSPKRNDKKVVTALRKILNARGVPDAEIGDAAKSPEDQPRTWVGDCAPSLTAAIRDDAVWINRSLAFDLAVGHIGDSLTRHEVWDMLEPFMGKADAYFKGVDVGKDDGAIGVATEEKAKDLVQKAGQWLSSRFGAGAGADFARMQRVYSEITRYAEENSANGATITDLVSALRQFSDGEGVKNSPEDNLAWIKAVSSYPGHSPNPVHRLLDQAEEGRLSKDARGALGAAARKRAQSCGSKIDAKGPRPYANVILRDVERTCGFTYLQDDGPARHFEYAVMLDHAARRVSITHSWIKRAEAERQRFSEDARRTIPEPAKQWLGAYCEARSGLTGAAFGYRIRPRAIKAWDRIIRRWSSGGCGNADDRIAAARELQADPEIDKFGDIQLFEALAADDTKCVWQCNGKATSDPLKDYVAAHDAMDKQRRFKVPAYRHPDPLAHPVFGDFGKSRWTIGFAVHEAASALGKTRQKIEREEAKVAKAQARLDKATTPQKRAKSHGDLKKAEQALREVREAEEWLSSRHSMSMGLWTGQNVQPTDLRWSSKRLTDDLALVANESGADRKDVTRADRLGRAAAGLSVEQAARVAGLFELKVWNGRLQAPRVQLDAIGARVKRHGWDPTARQMRDHLSWLVTFSAKLQCRGPWFGYVRTSADQTPFRKILKSGARQGQTYVSANGWPHSIANDNRGSLAAIILSRLPGLRVLSVDLGHRFAAACAVWETLTPRDFRREISDREVVDGGSANTDLYLHTRHTDTRGKQRTTIYRRIGADEVVDLKTGQKKPHSAPWARLDRQFLIKLQGEERPTRAASKEEIDTVIQLESDLGRLRDAHNRLPRRIDELMAEAVRSVRLALRHHGDAARIAYAFKPDGVLHPPGGGVKDHTIETRTNTVRDALVRWYERATSSRWKDDWASQQWEAYVKPHLTTALPQPDEDARGAERTKQRQSLEGALAPISKGITNDKSRLAELHKLWSVRWTAADATWKPRLRRLRNWFLPQGLRVRPDDTPQQAAARKARRDAARNVGGLSLARIATIRALYQLQKAYAMRPEPDDLRKNIAAKDDHRYDEFGRSILRVVERLREQRVKQLASRIVEASLGVGRMQSTQGRDSKRPQERRDAPCHAVVIENLRNYRPDELQTRRENRALMNWSAGKVRKYLEEGCQLHGLHLREVMPNYSSRQCSRSGAPGMRCDDVPVSEFITAPWWRKTINGAKKKINDKKSTDTEASFLCDLDERWATATDDQRKRATVRLPRKGGDLFVSAGHHNGAAIQADLNAAANIGLRALLDPDFPGRWWYVPCSSKDCRPAKEKIAGAACLDVNEPLAKAPSDTKKLRDIVNFWRDPSAALRAADDIADWQPTQVYWNTVRSRVIRNLRGFNSLANPLESQDMPW